MATAALSRLLNDQQLVWVPLSRPDYVLLIVAGLHQVRPCVACERTLQSACPRVRWCYCCARRFFLPFLVSDDVIRVGV